MNPPDSAATTADTPGSDLTDAASDLRAQDAIAGDSSAGDSIAGQAEEIGFAAAMSELNTIVAELESDLLDVDVLAERVERAAFLVQACRERLDATKLRVDEIIVRVDGSPTPESE